jgi:hypothetical protein
MFLVISLVHCMMIGTLGCCIRSILGNLVAASKLTVHPNYICELMIPLYFPP